MDPQLKRNVMFEFDYDYATDTELVLDEVIDGLDSFEIGFEGDE